MKLLAIFVALFAAAALAFGLTTHLTGFFLLFGFGAVCAVTTFFAGRISSYLKLFVAIFSVEYVLFGLPIIGRHIEVLPQLPPDFAMPVTAPLTVAMFSIAVFALAFIPIVKRTTAIADRYFEVRDRTVARIWPLPAFRADERTIAMAMVVFLVVVNQVQVLLNLRLSFFGRDFVNALNAQDQKAFWYQLMVVFPILAFPYVGSQIVEFVVQSTLIMRWRDWLTGSYSRRWLDKHTHYRMGLVGQSADNPDQRISEDIIRFVSGYGTPGGVGVYTISITLISKFSNLVSFAILLWSLSADFTFPGTSFAIPGFLFWCAVIYAVIGTVATHFLGRRLRPLSFARQMFEADFRFSLARLREYGEQIALLRGEPTEQRGLHQRFAAIVGNYFQIVDVRKILMGFTSFYGQLNPFIPYIVSAPFYFMGKISFGVLNQIATAFGNVSDALTFFIDFYVQLAEYQSVVDRLGSFDAALARAETGDGAVPAVVSPAGQDLTLQGVSIRLPDGRELLGNVNLSLAPRQSVLLTGPSGSGKSSLFRAVAGIWPYAAGAISIPAGASVMVLPQKPYFPIGSLRAAATYPSDARGYDEAAIVAALRAVGLEALAGQIDLDDAWSQRLSGGEQQRLAVARAILARPDWLLLDEATAALDEASEAMLYRSLAEHLPATTLVSIGHRSTLHTFHKRRIDMQPVAPGIHTPVPVALAAAE